MVFGLIPVLGVFILLIILGSFGVKKSESQQTASASGKITLAVSAQKNNDSDLAPRGLGDFENSVLGGPNATRDLAAKIAQEIISRNPNGPGPAGAQKLQLMKASEVTDKLIADSLKDFNPSAFYPPVSIADLNTISDSKEAFQSYFNNVQGILREKFGAAHFEQMSDLSKMNFPEILTNYAGAINDLLRLPVPQSLVAMHQKEISLVKGQAKAMSMLARYNDDPLQAYLALNIGDQLNDEFASLNKELTAFAEQHRLTI